jgi:3-oxoacyl-[acyl-carrier-protein] synthase III
MASNKKSEPSQLDIRIRHIAFSLPHEKIDLETLAVSQDDKARLHRLGQRVSHQSNTDSTSLMVEAAKNAISVLNNPADQIGMIISAPSLISAFGLEIPAVAIRSKLGLEKAECLNLSQGCVGALRAIEMAATYLKARPELKNVLVAIGCMASSLTENLNHGGFFWGDGATAVLVTSDPGPGLHFANYAESAAEKDWDAMKIRFGDGRPSEKCTSPEDFNIVVEFPDIRAQADYISAELRHFDNVIKALMEKYLLQDEQIEALILPSFGQNRVEMLLQNHQSLKDKIKTDFSYGHMGGVDNFLFLDRYASNSNMENGSWIIAMSPSFTSLWGGVLFNYRGKTE